MPETSSARRVAAPLPLVWRVFTDVPRLEKLLHGVSALDVLSPGTFGVGTRWRETRTLHGRTSTDELEVVECEPERRYVLESRGRARYRAEGVFDALGTEGTHVLVTLRTGGNPVTRLLSTLAWPVTGRTVRTVLAQDVDDLAAAAERIAGEPL